MFYCHRSRVSEEEYLHQFGWMFTDPSLSSASIAGLKFIRGTIRDYLFAFSFLITLPMMKLSKTFLRKASKYFAIACGLVVGLPVTIMLVYNGFFQNYYAGGFSAFVTVVFGGLAPILFTYLAVIKA